MGGSGMEWKVTDDSEEEEAADVLNRWMSHLDIKSLNVSDH